METFWFFWLWFRHAYDSAYDSDFLFSLGHKRWTYNSTYNSESITREKQPQVIIKKNSSTITDFGLNLQIYCSFQKKKKTGKFCLQFSLPSIILVDLLGNRTLL